MLGPHVLSTPILSVGFGDCPPPSPLYTSSSDPPLPLPQIERPKRSKASKNLTLILACLIPFGAHYAKQTLPPLRPYFEAAPGGISSSEFGLLLSAASWPNLFQPFLAGLFVDAKGHEHGAVVFTMAALLGHALFATSLHGGIDMRSSLIGRIIFGLGLGGSGIVQGALLGHHFDSDLTYTIGLCESFQHLASWLGKATPVMIADQFNGSYAASIWFGCFILLISCFSAILHFVYEEMNKPFSFALLNDRKSLQQIGEGDDRSSSAAFSTLSEEQSYFQFSRTLIRQLPYSFWMVGILHLLFSNTGNLFAGFATSFFVEEYQLSRDSAALYASIDALLPVFISPLIGKITFLGKLTICTFSAMFSLIAFTIFLNFRQSFSGPLFPILLLSISSSMTPTIIKSWIPLICPRSSIGTAFSLYFVFESLGASIGHVSLGYLRDETQNFDLDLKILIVVTFIALIFTIVLRFYDKSHFDGILNHFTTT